MRILSETEKKMIRELYRKDYRAGEIAKKPNVHFTTVWKYLKRISKDPLFSDYLEIEKKLKEYKENGTFSKCSENNFIAYLLKIIYEVDEMYPYGWSLKNLLGRIKTYLQRNLVPKYYEEKLRIWSKKSQTLYSIIRKLRKKGIVIVKRYKKNNVRYKIAEDMREFAKKLIS
jgi:predicted DNA-binding protein YlxM (UPF0122 family)